MARKLPLQELVNSGVNIRTLNRIAVKNVSYSFGSGLELADAQVVVNDAIVNEAPEDSRYYLQLTHAEPNRFAGRFPGLALGPIVFTMKVGYYK